MPFIVFIFMLAFTEAISQTQPYFFDVAICADSTFRQIGDGQHSASIIKQYTTTHFDSAMTCETDTCFWKYSSKLDSSIDISLSWQGTFYICFKYSLFDPNNRTWQICLSNVSYNSNFLTVDSLWGDVASKPGVNKFIECILRGKSTCFDNMIIQATAIDANSEKIEYKIPNHQRCVPSWPAEPNADSLKDIIAGRWQWIKTDNTYCTSSLGGQCKTGQSQYWDYINTYGIRISSDSIFIESGDSIVCADTLSLGASNLKIPCAANVFIPRTEYQSYEYKISGNILLLRYARDVQYSTIYLIRSGVPLNYLATDNQHILHNTSMLNTAFAHFDKTSCSIKITYYLNFSNNISFELYDITGRLVNEYHPVNQKPGMQTISISNPNLPSGTYFIRVVGQNFSTATKSLFIR